MPLLFLEMSKLEMWLSGGHHSRTRLVLEVFKEKKLFRGKKKKALKGRLLVSRYIVYHVAQPPYLRTNGYQWSLYLLILPLSV